MQNSQMCSVSRVTQVHFQNQGSGNIIMMIIKKYMNS